MNPPFRATDEELAAAFGVIGSFAGVARLFGYTRERIRQRLTALGYRSEAKGPPPRIPHKNTCEICGRVFYPENADSRFCSSACWGVSLRKYTTEELREILARYGGNIKWASEETGISQLTFYRRLGSGGTGRRNQRTRSAPTHCRHGHEWTPDNTGLWNGHHFCRACQRERDRKRYQDKKARGLKKAA